ncbi:MAG: hypothetical protein F6K40_28895 [Okeania sp. SIO3I5]|uniref:hypothetical protein n=1 Tax=Okeania sp. SIO3I5 TaxID=2607805 RepID=UPI0013B9C43E|nr:hypothetical protein [Okeania sp. SIO3I5]NEQ40044.1 hypothetical protein [Okeania sp. SIO3I5]
MKRIFVGLLTVATVLSIASPARSNRLNDLYYSCYEDGNAQSCGRLGILCGQGNSRACSLVQTASRAGILQINYYCRQRNNNRACNFLQLVSQAGGVGNLARFCSQGDPRACNAVSIVACYASENARAGRGPRCRALD